MLHIQQKKGINNSHHLSWLLSRHIKSWVFLSLRCINTKLCAKFYTQPYITHQLFFEPFQNGDPFENLPKTLNPYTELRSIIAEICKVSVLCYSYRSKVSFRAWYQSVYDLVVRQRRHLTVMSQISWTVGTGDCEKIIRDLMQDWLSFRYDSASPRKKRKF
ncbi:hypothetical protein CLIB1423_08S03114 [[Candida] railenensis]|uniref:Uncharacterized protein n=1 Tax=[Candida] railenensis TaxID=45579 RepID=A0A9P0QQ66_9ASCO|nr:hypothetical protein CLIB1423_08S03114 [[Candida] railenensis]